MNQLKTERLLVAPCDPTRPFFPPQRFYEGDAGYDLSASQRIVVAPGAFAQIPTNVRVALPHGTWGMVIGRSSTFYKRNLLVNTAIIDNGWTDELFGVVYNPTSRRVYIGIKERLVQLIIFNLITPGYDLVETLPARERGSKGFGSTGGMNPNGK